MSEREENGPGGRRFDLGERTFEFARRVRALLKRVRTTIANQEDGRQVIRAFGSEGANYIEANEAVSKKDFVLRIKICRKEAKESHYFLRLLDLEGSADTDPERAALVQEAQELTSIFGAIVRKSE